MVFCCIFLNWNFSLIKWQRKIWEKIDTFLKSTNTTHHCGSHLHVFSITWKMFYGNQTLAHAHITFSVLWWFSLCRSSSPISSCLHNRISFHLLRWIFIILWNALHVWRRIPNEFWFTRFWCERSRRNNENVSYFFVILRSFNIIFAERSTKIIVSIHYLRYSSTKFVFASALRNILNSMTREKLVKCLARYIHFFQDSNKSLMPWNIFIKCK